MAGQRPKTQIIKHSVNHIRLFKKHEENNGKRIE